MDYALDVGNGRCAARGGDAELIRELVRMCHHERNNRIQLSQSGEVVALKLREALAKLAEYERAAELVGLDISMPC